MKAKEFVDNMKANTDNEVIEEIYKDKPGYLISNKRFSTKTHFTFQSIKDNEWGFLSGMTIWGRDIDFIGRVTGYFVRYSSINPGKRGEWKDRFRSTV